MTDYLPQGRSVQPIEILRPHPDNPHVIDPTQMALLRGSITHDPNFMLKRPVLVSDGPKYQLNRLIYAGHQRIKALQTLYAEGFDPKLWPVGHVPISCQDVDERVAMERLIRDNNHWADWVEEKVAQQLKQLQAHGSNMAVLGFVQEELDALLQHGIEHAPRASLGGALGETGPLGHGGLPDSSGGGQDFTIRKIELHYMDDEFDQVVANLDRVRQHYRVDSNAEAVLALLRERRQLVAA